MARMTLVEKCKCSLNLIKECLEEDEIKYNHSDIALLEKLIKKHEQLEKALDKACEKLEELDKEISDEVCMKLWDMGVDEASVPHVDKAAWKEWLLEEEKEDEK